MYYLVVFLFSISLIPVKTPTSARNPTPPVLIANTGILLQQVLVKYQIETTSVMIYETLESPLFNRGSVTVHL